MTRITKMARKTFVEASGFTPQSIGSNESNVESNVHPSRAIHTTDSQQLDNPSQSQQPLNKKHRFKKDPLHQTNPQTNNNSKPSTSTNTSSQQKKNSVPRRDRKLQCYNCRRTGHTIQRCPSEKTLLKCYICGSTEHSITKCLVKKDPVNPFPFANCFVCGEMGHVSGQCAQNLKGIYPKGGACLHCDSVRHLAKDCDVKEKQGNKRKMVEIELGVVDLKQGADDDDVHIVLQEASTVIHEERLRRQANPKGVAQKKANVVNF